jgi:exodeoxyribonuclease V alpha subunit
MSTSTTVIESLYLTNSAFERRTDLLRAAGVLSATDLLVLDRVAPRFGETNPEVLLGLALAVRAPRVGDIGVHLASIGGRIDLSSLEGARPDTEQAPVVWPDDLPGWEAAVVASPMVGGPADVDRPFVRQHLLDGRTLVLTRRMWREQERLAVAITHLASGTPDRVLPEATVAAGVEQMFGGPESQGARAVSAAASRCLTVVTGGPGTGKTYSIKRLLALLVDATNDSTSPLRIELAAPTGKAAVRMADAIAEDLDALRSITEETRTTLRNLQPRTLHKLLGARPDGSCRHGKSNRIAADLVVVDEASMVDLAMMRRLFESIPDGARLVLLGDRDQLASVEAGCVLSDIVAPVLDGGSLSNRALHGAVVHFDTNHRFDKAPTIAAIAKALQARSDDSLTEVGRLMDGARFEPNEGGEADPIKHLGAPVDGRPSPLQLDALAAPYLDSSGFIGTLATAIRTYGPHAAELEDPSLHLTLLTALDRYRVLAVHRRGPLGVSGVERALAKRCRAELKQAIGAHAQQAGITARPLPARGEHWIGRPVLITQNAYELGLMNGDIGIVLPTAMGPAVVLPVKEGDRLTTREISLSRLPAHMGAFAMTVHKSQGSQFDRVALVLAGRDSPIQTRELVYTAITRSSGCLDWLGHPSELQGALRRRVGRASGLGDLLWGPED